MARLIGQVLGVLRGSIGGLLTFSQWRGVPYVRAKSLSITNPRSEGQADIRARITHCSRRWYEILTIAQRNEWSEFALQQGSASLGAIEVGAGTKQVIPGTRGVMSGFNAYIMNNVLAFTAGSLPAGLYVDDAPLGQPIPNPPTELTGVWRPDICAVDLSWTTPQEQPIVSRIRVWTVSLNAFCHKQIVANVGVPTDTASITDIRIAKGKLNPIRKNPGEYHFQADAIDNLGLRSPPSNVFQIIVPSNCIPGP